MSPNPWRCLSAAGAVGLDFLNANGRKNCNGLPQTSFSIKWWPPDQEDVFKLNFDGSVAGSRAAAAFVI